ncbi:MAG: ABC transporter substrate binding protein [Chloroflexi bacterium]|nr:ABC transporter substrate binding protein [Chloroflexota bacterium]
MYKKALFLFSFACLIIFAPIATAQDNPTIAILRFGALPNVDITEGAILDVLESYGFISTEENRIFEARRDYEGEHITIYWGDAGFDFPTVNLMLEDALDKEVDVLITNGATVTQTAVHITSEMDMPTPVIFVSTPYEGGIAAEAACVKPDHVAGVSAALSYDYAFSVLLMQDPDIERVGVIHSTSDASGRYGAQKIMESAESLGIKIHTAGVVSLSDLRPAANSLVDAGVGAILLPLDTITTSGLPVITEIASEIGLPVFYPSFSAIYYGATIGAGSSPMYTNGVNLGRILTAYLNGDVDLARVGIGTTGDLHIGVNLDSAEAQGIDISEAVMNEAIAVIESGGTTKLAPEVLAAIARRGKIIPLEQRDAGDQAWLASLHCTDEMIAERQAALDAASG